MKYRSLLWKIPLALVGVGTGIVILLLIAVASVLCVPSLRTAALRKGVAIANEKTDWDIDLGRLYLSPFHHSPMVLYRAYKGQADLPVAVEIDSLFVGHRGQDTLVYVHTLRLRATAFTQGRSLPDSILSTPIVVDELLLDQPTFHSGALIKTVGVDVVVERLALASPEVLIAEGKYPLHGLQIIGANVGIDLRPSPPKKEPKKKSSPLRLAFDLPDGELRDIHFRLTPLGLDIRTGSLSTNALVDVGGNTYDARRLNVGDFALSLGKLYLPFDTVYGNGRVELDKHLITSTGLHARSEALGATADLSYASMDLKAMRAEAVGDAEFQGSKASLNAWYDIDDEAYNASVRIHRVNLAPFLKDSVPVALAGDVEAVGRGINPKKPLSSRVSVRLDQALYGTYDLSHTSVSLATDTATSLALATPGIDLSAATPMPLFAFINRLPSLIHTVTDSAVLASLTSLRDLTVLDTIRTRIPALETSIALRQGSLLQPFIDSLKLNLERADLSFRSDSAKTDIAFDAAAAPLNLQPSSVNLKLGMTEGMTSASLAANTTLTDGVMDVTDICTDAALRMNLTRYGRKLTGTGRLTLDSLSYQSMDLGSRAVDIALSPSQEYPDALRAEVKADDIPLSILDGLVHLPDIDLQGAVRASAAVDGLPRKTDISAEVQPIGVAAEYKPYQVGISLGETPIVMSHNKLDLNGLPVYAADSTFVALYGGLDLNTMRMDVTLEADSFAPVKLPQGGPLPVYGELAADLRGSVTGPLDSILADVDITVLPTTDITYPIDKKNLAQVKPHGTVNVRFNTADSKLVLGGRINVDDGLVRYSPKLYPVMPFRVDSGSRVTFNGPIGKTRLDVSASQQVKADVEAEGEDTRRVDFRTGVRVNGIIDSIGIESIGFFLEAPADERVTHELASVDEDTREGLAATLLATGMYVGESNEAAQRDGYALTSIINSRINAAMANSKIGKFMDVDFSSGQTHHATGKSNDMNIAISKSFFKDRLRITVGSTISDNPDVNKANGLFSFLTADYKILPKPQMSNGRSQTSNTSLAIRLYSQRDYNNILEGELLKSGLSVRADKEWRRRELFRGDSLTRTYGLAADAGVAYRSNNSIGPDLTLKSTIRNVLGNGETFTVKANGAYYWALRNRHPGDPKKTDTYKLGVNASLVLPYLHWTGENNPEGDTRYMLGYQYENIAGGYGVHKLSGSFTYFIRSARNAYITHAFTPFSLSVVLMKAESENLLDKAEEYPQLIKVLAGDEFVPAVGYNFIYNNYRAKRAVNTMLDLGVKESGNLISALYCLSGQKWNDSKKLGNITINQFVKFTAELRNKFNITDKVCIATRLFVGANIPLGNSSAAPLSEAFYTGGPNSLRATSPSSYGPGNFYSAKYNQSFFHAGDVKLEANFELRFPIVWKLYGATFLDAGNVWNWTSTADIFKKAGIEDYKSRLELPDDLHDGILNNPYWARQIALGTGAGLRLDIDGLVIRLDLGVAIHAPYQTFKYDKDGKPDKTQPISTYFNIPSALDALRINFGIGYPF